MDKLLYALLLLAIVVASAAFVTTLFGAGNAEGLRELTEILLSGSVVAALVAGALGVLFRGPIGTWLNRL